MTVTKSVSYYQQYTIVKFTGTGSLLFNPPPSATFIDYLIVAGGGSGGGANAGNSGGGGAGGVLSGSHLYCGGGTLTITVGAGHRTSVVSLPGNSGTGYLRAPPILPGSPAGTTV